MPASACKKKIVIQRVFGGLQLPDVPARPGSVVDDHFLTEFFCELVPHLPRDRIDGTSLFFCNDTATTEIYTLSLHDALPIATPNTGGLQIPGQEDQSGSIGIGFADRKSTRLNSSHEWISYAVFCLTNTKNTFLGLVKRSNLNEKYHRSLQNLRV